MHLVVMCYCRRKFRSQTSDNMDRWKAELGRVREEKRRRKRKSQKKEDPGAIFGRKVAKHCVFPVAPEGRKVGSLKRRVRSQLARWEMKNCTPLWREAHFRVKSVKNWRVRATFGSWDDEKLHAVVAQSTFPSQKCKKLTGSDHFWKLRCRKSAHRCGGKHISKSKYTKHTTLRPLLEVEMSKKRTWHEAHFEVKMSKNTCSDHFLTFRCRFAWQAQGIVQLVLVLSKLNKTRWFCSISKNDGRRGAFEEDLQRCIFRGRRSTRDMFIRAVRRSGRWFPEHQIFRVAEMILRDRCSTSYDLASLFRGRSSTLDRWWKNRKTHSYEAVSSALNFPCLKEISQKCFVFDVVNFKRCGSLADMLRFRRCQVEKLRTSRRIAAFLMLSSSKTEEVSQNSFVFKLADRQIDRETTATTTTTTGTTTLHYYYNYKYKYTTLHYTTLIRLRYTNYI